MQWVETTGRTVEEAKDKALDQLGVDEADAEFEILEEPKPGLFGRTRGEGRVRARVMPIKARPKVERRDLKRKTGASEPRSTEQGGPTAEPGNTPEDEMDETTDVVPVSNGDVSAQEGERAAAFLVGLAQVFGSTGSTEIVMVDDGVEVNLTGDDLGLLIGPKGSTLTAVQDITRVVAQQRGERHEGRLRIDIAGYRAHRAEALSRFTAQVASEVLATGAARRLEPMSSADRKVVHDAAGKIEGITTSSEGEEPARRVVISVAS